MVEGIRKQSLAIWSQKFANEVIPTFDVSEDEIRKELFGDHLDEIHLGVYDHTLTRPTTASARRSVIWSSDRKVYETASLKRMEEFNSRPYMRYQYPEIPRHWPGTWRVVSTQELKSIVERLSRPTVCYKERSKSASAHRTSIRQMQAEIPKYQPQYISPRTPRTPRTPATPRSPRKARPKTAKF